jgi:hypothetical protein
VIQIDHTRALTALALLLMAPNALAAPPGQVSLAVERLFGISRISAEAEIGNISVDTTTTSVSLFGTPFLGPAYSSPRLGIDYLTQGGLSFGGALSYQSVSTEGDGGGEVDASLYVLAPRLGYFLQATPSWGVWPRLGITHRGAGEGIDQDLTALTAEVPLVYLVAAGNVGLTVMPHLDFGIAGSVGSGSDAIDQTATELGILFGMKVFF